jgi:hypothetical protein
MMLSALDKWAQAQVNALIAMGDRPLDAEKVVRAALRRLRIGVDPATPIAPVEIGPDGQVTSDDIADARADWYASRFVPKRYKRLLDAKEPTP